jgi:hypothetical protein
MARGQFAKGSSKIGKPRAGRGTVERTPLTIRSRQRLGGGFEQRVREQIARRVGRAAGVIERLTIRFDDVNGPKGGIDTVCRIKAVVSGRPSIVVEKRADSEDVAFSQAASALATAVARTQGKHRLRTGHHAGPSTGPRARASAPDEGELIGRRVGRGKAGLSRALHRPEKQDRAHYVDTAAHGASASDRRAGGPFTARRNTLARTTRATATLEDSRTRPSRKSTRKSANRGKPSQTKERAALANALRPQAKASRRG